MEREGIAHGAGTSVAIKRARRVFITGVHRESPISRSARSKATKYYFDRSYEGGARLPALGRPVRANMAKSINTSSFFAIL